MLANHVSPDSRPVARSELVQEYLNVDRHTSAYNVVPGLGNSSDSVTEVPQESRFVATAPLSFVSTPLPGMSPVTSVVSSVPIGPTIPPWRRPYMPRQNRPARSTGQQQTSLLSSRQMFQQRLQKYRLSAKFDVEQAGPQHAQQWRGTFRIGEYEVGQSPWYSNKNAAKEHAASCAIAWMNQYGYE